MEKETKVEMEKSDEKAKNDKKQDMSLKKKIWRTVLVCLAICAFFAVVFVVLYYTGAWDFLKNQDKVQTWIKSLGFWGLLIFVVLQFLQVTFLPLPSTVTTLAGVYVFGSLKAALLSLAGVILGSVFAFFLGRVFGRKLVEFMVGKETCQKWTDFLTDAKYAFVIMMILPIFPDDVLCLVAGLTDMSWTFFVVTNLISRPLAIFTTCYSIKLIPLEGWGWGVWAAIIVVVLILLYLSVRYREQIENFIRKTFRTKKQKAEQENTSQPFEVSVKALKNDKQNASEQKTEKDTKKAQKAQKNAQKSEKVSKNDTKTLKNDEKSLKNASKSAENVKTDSKNKKKSDKKSE